MPGQGRQKRRQEAASRRAAALTTPDAGRWQVLIETRDRAELQAHTRSLQEARVDASLIRIDVLCRRPTEQSTYRLSRFVTAGEE
ncbi:hypothetical protein ACIQK9_09970 [Streptomyces hydrogenans]|uniref:hypothetical protein n=1 Tax=Streptomyces hydrogenans TaxID=1873719 RepID=UPI00382799F1